MIISGIIGVVSSVLLLQTAAVPSEFEAAVIKLAKPSAADSSLSGDYQHGRLVIHNATLRVLINTAYGVRTDLITGGPSWIDEDYFDVAAKADPATSEADSRLMLRKLLEETFKLAMHHESRPREVFALTVAKTGLKIQPTPEGSAVQSGCSVTPLVCHKVALSILAQMLPGVAPRDIDRPVIDLTGLSGYYDFRLSYRSRSGQTVFEALGELGLQLEPGKHPTDVLVIDSVARLQE
jgi:uncharacterized protein (TIGR03435 family)